LVRDLIGALVSTVRVLSAVPTGGVIAHAEAVGAMGNRVSARYLAEAKALLIRGNDLAKLPPLTDWAQAGL